MQGKALHIPTESQSFTFRNLKELSLQGFDGVMRAVVGRVMQNEHDWDFSFFPWVRKGSLPFTVH